MAQIENKVSNPQPKTLEQVAAALGISTAQLKDKGKLIRGFSRFEPQRRFKASS